MNLNTLKNISYCGSNRGYEQAMRETVKENNPTMTPKEIDEETEANLEKATLFNPFNKRVVATDDRTITRLKRRIKNGKRTFKSS